MRILICGDRNWTDYISIRDTLKATNCLNLPEGERVVECVIEGEARGADTLGRIAAEELKIPVLKFPAKWDEHGKAAGPIRNQQMLDEGKPDIICAFHNDLPNSKGTKDMITRAKKAGLPVFHYKLVLQRTEM